MTSSQPQVLNMVVLERIRQNSIWGWPQHNTIPEWGLILSEEVGEVAQEMLRFHFGAKEPDDLVTELIQVAAVAVSIVEHLIEAKLIDINQFQS